MPLWGKAGGSCPLPAQGSTGAIRLHACWPSPGPTSHLNPSLQTLPTTRSQVYLRPAKQEQWPWVGREGTWVPGPPEPDTPPSHASKESLPSRLHIPIPYTRGLEKIFFESPAIVHPSRPPASVSLAGEASNPLLASARAEQELTWRERPAWLGVTPLPVNAC